MSDREEALNNLQTLLASRHIASEWHVRIDFEACVSKAIKDHDGSVLGLFASADFEFREQDLMWALVYAPEYAAKYVERAAREVSRAYLISMVAMYEKCWYVVAKDSVFVDFLAYLKTVSKEISTKEEELDMLVEIGVKFDCLTDFWPFFTKQSFAKSLTEYAQNCKTVEIMKKLLTCGVEFDKTLKTRRFLLDHRQGATTEENRRAYATVFALGYRFDDLPTNDRASWNFYLFLNALEHVKYGRVPAMPISPEYTTCAAKYLLEAEKSLVLDRIFHIVVALRDLPALILLHIVDFENEPFALLVAPWIKYTLITKCKHFSKTIESKL